jgi:hypothetical protein
VRLYRRLHACAKVLALIAGVMGIVYLDLPEMTQRRPVYLELPEMTQRAK